MFTISASYFSNPMWHRAKHLWRFGRSPLPLERPNLSELAKLSFDELPLAIQHAKTADTYRRFLGVLPWHSWSQRLPERTYPGPTPRSLVPYVAAFLIKLDLGFTSMQTLRRFLVSQPELLWVLGFPLMPSSHFPWGFDPEASLPAPSRFSRILRQLENLSLQTLLTETVMLVQQQLPDEALFGQVVSLDTKHIIAWIRENNPKSFIKEGRFDKTKQPRGDQDCKLGCKRRRNQGGNRKTPPNEGIPAHRLGVSVGELYWGYASGVVATKVPDVGEFILAEMTQTFDHSDASYFQPLMAQCEQRLGFAPPFGALDAAYDAWYVYEYFHKAGGFAAVPRVQRGADQQRLFDEDGLPLCEAKLSMPLKSTYVNRTSLVHHERGRYVCPLLFPQVNGRSCPINHKKWPKGGCVTSLATSIGARLRHQLDRDNEAYQAIYAQRTAVERIFSQARALGIERPKLRNQRSIANQNTLTYVLLNLRALVRMLD